MMIQWCFVINFKIYTRTTLRYFPMQQQQQQQVYSVLPFCTGVTD